MTGTMEGLSVPLYGEFYRFSEAQTQNLYMEDDGVVNITITDPGADNCIALTVTDGSTVTSGYLQGYYCAMTVSTAGNYSTGNSQINTIAVDLALNGTVACEAEAMYIYVYGSTTSTLTNANISGIVVYMAATGSTAASQSNIFLHWDESAAPVESAYIFMKGEGGHAPEYGFNFRDELPTYFVGTSHDGDMVENITISTGTQNKVLKCSIEGSTYWIPLYAASA